MLSVLRCRKKRAAEPQAARLAESGKERSENMNEENRKECGCKHIKGVSCDVRNCVHHDANDCCTAGEITVGPSYASTSNDTACATFQPKSE